MKKSAGVSFDTLDKGTVYVCRYGRPDSAGRQQQMVCWYDDDREKWRGQIFKVAHDVGADMAKSLARKLDVTQLAKIVP